MRLWHAIIFGVLLVGAAAYIFYPLTPMGAAEKAECKEAGGNYTFGTYYQPTMGGGSIEKTGWVCVR